MLGGAHPSSFRRRGGNFRCAGAKIHLCIVHYLNYTIYIKRNPVFFAGFSPFLIFFSQFLPHSMPLSDAPSIGEGVGAAPIADAVGVAPSSEEAIHPLFVTERDVEGAVPYGFYPRSVRGRRGRRLRRPS